MDVSNAAISVPLHADTYLQFNFFVVRGRRRISLPVARPDEKNAVDATLRAFYGVIIHNPRDNCQAHRKKRKHGTGLFWHIIVAVEHHD